ncbi:MAG: hypothetical protein AAGF20_03280 [Pseudomonadota bacterium]
MPPWERNYWVLAISVLLSSSYYFGTVISKSLAAGAVIAPSLKLIIVYVVLQIVLSVGGVVAFIILARIRSGEDGLDEKPDERDLAFQTRAEAGAGHLLSFGVAVALVYFFAHRNGDLLFHTVLAGLVLGEMARCVIQIIAYRRGY